MAFATLEEAWGVRAFANENAAKPAPKRPAVVSSQMVVPRRPAPAQPVPVARQASVGIREAVRQALDTVLRSQGRDGVAQLLGDDLMRRVCGPMGGPITFETVVTLLIAAFAIFVLLDSLF